MRKLQSAASEFQYLTLALSNLRRDQRDAEHDYLIALREECGRLRISDAEPWLKDAWNEFGEFHGWAPAVMRAVLPAIEKVGLETFVSALQRFGKADYERVLQNILGSFEPETLRRSRHFQTFDNGTLS